MIENPKKYIYSNQKSVGLTKMRAGVGGECLFRFFRRNEKPLRKGRGARKHIFVLNFLVLFVSRQKVHKRKKEFVLNFLVLFVSRQFRSTSVNTYKK
jgi:hypothetical protein